MSRVALYARYSSDRQRTASIEDQLRLCRDHAIVRGWKIVSTYTDEAASGASLNGRPGMLAMLGAAREGRFDIVVAEALDRLSRDQEDIARLFKMFRFAGIGLSTVSEGQIDELHVGLKGTMNALFLTDLSSKTRRGLRGRIEQGRSGGGLCYGYDVRIDADGEVGGRIVNEAQADVVRRILTEYADGAVPRVIAERLNKEGVPGVGGRPWTASTIRGHRARGSGMINNMLYVGELVWNGSGSFGIRKPVVACRGSIPKANG
jgi:DNA invertase Pin-like site-specific DNA recombinase